MDIGFSDDYCSADLTICGQKYLFYYGYEEVEQCDQWLFVVRKHGEAIYRYNPHDQRTDPIEVWAKCVGRFIEQYMVMKEDR